MTRTPRTRVAPPRLAERLLGALVGSAAWRETVLGDLHEEFAWRSEDHRMRAAAWYWWQAARIGARHAARDAMRAARSPRHVRPQGDSVMRVLGQDLRFALRTLVKQPGLTLIVVVTLALGIGANASVFGLIERMVLDPFPIPNVDRMVMVAEPTPGSIFLKDTVSPADFLDIAAETHTLSAVAAYEWWDVNLSGRDEPERVQGFYVSPSFLRVLGVTPALGRDFLPEEADRGRHQRVILGDGLWHRRFAGDPAVVGRTVLLDREPYTVVGIAPPGFEFPMGSELWAPLSFDAKTAAERGRHYLTVIGRLADGRTLADARAELRVIGARLAHEHPRTNENRAVLAVPLREGLIDEGSPAFLALWQVSAGLVLLIACANVANLLLARGAERHREIAVRLAIGASRWRLVRQLLTENLSLAALAVPPALGVTWFGLRLIRTSMPARIARFVQGWNLIGIDGRVVLFVVAVAVTTAVVFGMVPALQASRPRLNEALREGGRGTTGGRARARLRHALVVGQIALALALLAASGLTVAGTLRFLTGPQGYDPDGVLTLQLSLPDSAYGQPDARRTFATAVLDRLETLPGATGVGLSNILPSSGNNSSRSLILEGAPDDNPDRRPLVDVRAISDGYLRTMRIPVVEGRAFTTADGKDSQMVALVSRSFARQYWPDQDPLGRRLKLTSTDGPWLTVVGVVGDVIQHWFAGRSAAVVYQPYRQAPTGYFGLVLRTGGDPLALAQPARAAILSVDPNQPAFDVMSQRQMLRDRTIGLQFAAAIMGVFALLSLGLALFGVYGVMAYAVTQRRHEIGVRIALGAQGRDVLRLVIGQTWRLTIAGVVIGLGLAMVIGRVMASSMFGAYAMDLRLFAAVAVALVAVALLAGYVPARRATHVDPITELRTL